MRIYIYIFALMTILATSAHAGELSAKAGAAVVLINRADNLWTGGKPQIQSIYERPKTATKILPFPILDITHIDNASGTEYFFGTSKDEPGSLTLGRGRDFDNDTYLEIYGFYSLKESGWKNPYALNRETTDIREYGAKFIFEYKALSLSYKITQTDFKNDDIGALFPELKRSGSTHAVGLSYQQMLDITYGLTPGIIYEKGVYDGKSNSYEMYEAFLGFDYMKQDISFNTKISAKISEFDKTHPLYQQSREDKTYGASAIATFMNPFGMKNYFATAGAIASKTDSNIKFFDSRSVISFCGAGYKF
ncbi:MAG: DUF2860 domain-containing protein [Nitrospirae bacterium]|nr:MAG: DUF2860 domain-containing protein [Nitrospirota bacterium]